MVVLDQYWSCIGSIVMPTLDQNSNASIPYGANIGPVSQCYCLHMGPVLVHYWQNYMWPEYNQYETIIYTGLIVVPHYWPRIFLYWLSTGWPLNGYWFDIGCPLLAQDICILVKSWLTIISMVV